MGKITDTQRSSRIAKNTILLSVRMVIVMIINLYSVRIVLNALGVEDYGIYNVVAGVIVMLQSLNSVFATTTQRYYSFSMGENKSGALKVIFSASVDIYILFSILIFIIGETIGLWFVNTKLVIPEYRIVAANYIYQFSIFSFVFTIMQTPFSALIIAYENMKVFALISTLEAVLKLMFALLLSEVHFDRLIFYALGLLIVPLISMFIYILVGYRQYTECRYQRGSGRILYKSMLSFSGWTLFASLAGVGINQVNTILTNVFFGPVVNASRAIALQINSAMNSFCASFLMAIKPPMIKSYAEHDYQYLNKIFYLSNKFVYYSLLAISIPLIFEMHLILKLWLKTVENQTVLFAQLILVYTLIMSLNNPIAIIVQATGHVKEYSSIVEIFTLLTVPITYILFKIGYPAHSTFVVMIIAAVIAHVFRLYYLKKCYSSFSYFVYFKCFVLPAFMVTFITVIIVAFLYLNIPESLLRLVVVFLMSMLSIAASMIFIGFSSDERKMIKLFIFKRIKSK